MTYISCETVVHILTSQRRYFIFCGYGTCGTDDIGVGVPEEGPAPRTGPADAGFPTDTGILGRA